MSGPIYRHRITNIAYIIFCPARYEFLLLNAISKSYLSGGVLELSCENDLPASIVIPFARKPRAEITPNMRSSRNFNDLSSYDECLLVTFASLRRFNKDRPLKLVTNAPPPALVCYHLEKLHVDIAFVPFEHVAPDGFGGQFQASLYYLDMLPTLSPENCLILDPDVLCVRNLDPIFRDFPPKVGVLPIPYDIDFSLNGLSRGQAGRIYNELGEGAEPTAHFGGEAYYIPGLVVPELARRLDAAWTVSMSRFVEDLPYFVTEEHFFSFGLRAFEQKSLAPYVKRIWTTRRQRNVTGNEGVYSLWHLPAEKGRGFQRMFSDALNEDSWFWTASPDEFRDRAGAVMGFYDRPLGRFLSETVFGGIQTVMDSRRGIVRQP